MSKHDLWNPQYRNAIFPTVVAEGLFCKLGTNEKELVVVDDAADTVIGPVRLAATAAGREGEIFEEGGDAYGTSGAAITKGAELVVDADGKIQPRAAAAGTYTCVGIALEAASAADQTTRFRFTKFTRVVS